MAANLGYVQILNGYFAVFELVHVPRERMPELTCWLSSPARARDQKNQEKLYQVHSH